MKFMGSKARFAKEILPIILKDRKEDQWFVDLFCGGANLLDKVGGKRIGNDKNKYLIALWKGLQEDRELILDIPKELFSEERTEYIAPEDFECIWQKDFKSSLSANGEIGGNKISTEKLFKYNICK